MRIRTLAPCLLVWSLAGVARAEDAEGLVRVLGTELNTETMLTPPTEYGGTKLCPSATEQRIRHLTALTVKVSGDWKKKKNGDRSCLDVAQFTVLKMTSGRTPAAGLLSAKDGAYFVTGDDGKALAIAEVPEGLKKLVGKKVLVDLKEVLAVSPTKDSANANFAPASKEAPPVVVTYQAYP